MIRGLRVYIESIELVQVLRVIRRGPPEVPIKSTDHRKRPADSEVAVEIDHARHGHMCFVVSGGPLQVRVTKQDRLSGLCSTRCERPRIRTVVRTPAFFVSGWGWRPLVARRRI